MIPSGENQDFPSVLCEASFESDFVSAAFSEALLDFAFSLGPLEDRRA